MTSVAPRRRAAALLGGLVALCLLVLAAGPASAHASLVETTPFDGQSVAEAPSEVAWTFNEAVTSTSGALRIFDADGERVDTGEQTHPAPEQLTVGLRDDVGAGSYVATYRVTSADGHVIRGAFVFQVGDGAAVGDDTLAAIFASGGDGVVAAVAGVARAVGYAGALLLGGALLWSVVVARGGRSDERPRADAWARRGAVLAGAAALVAIPAQAMLTSGLGLGALGTGRVLAETATSSVGIGALARLAAAVLVVVLLRGGDTSRDLAGVAGLAVLATFLVDGHTRTADPAWLMLAGDAVHLLAGAAWFGGLVVLAGTIRARRHADDPIGAAEVVARFSRVATWAVVAVAIAGGAMSWALVRQPRALVGTEYGWTLLAKVGLVAVVVLVGAYNNRRLVPAIERAATPAGGSVDTSATSTDEPAPEAVDRRQRIAGAAWRQLGRTTRFEIGVLVAVLAVTAFLVNLRPAAEEAGITGAFDSLVAIDDTDLQLNLVVDPNRVGHNEIHFYVLDRTGRPVSELDSVEVRLTQPERDIGPIVREPDVAGPGHWQLDGNDLGVPGEWVIELVVGIDRFTEERVEVPVVVNP
jgi:copper transport protein